MQVSRILTKDASWLPGEQVHGDALETPLQFGAGNIQATRVAAVRQTAANSASFVVATGNRVILAKMSAHPAQPHKKEEKEKEEEEDNGKSTAPLPVPAKELVMTTLEGKHRSDVQTVQCIDDTAAGGVVVGAVDAFGFGRVSFHTEADNKTFMQHNNNDDVDNMDVDVVETEAEEEASQRETISLKRARKQSEYESSAVLKLDAVMPNQRMEREMSWAGLSFAPESTWNSGRAVVSHLMARETIVHEWNGGGSSGSAGEARAIARFGHVLNPTAVKFLHGDMFGSNVVACVEWSFLSVWDVRTGSRVASMEIQQGERTPLYALAVAKNTSSNGTPVVVVGGQGRVAHTVDSRMWLPRQRYKLPLKLDLVGLEMDADGSMLYAVGRDNELVCQAMDQTSHADSAANKNKLTRKEKKFKKQERDAAKAASVAAAASSNTATSAATNGAVTALAAETPKLAAPTGGGPSGQGLQGLLYWNHRMFRSESPWVGFALLDNKNKESSMDSIVGVTRECTAYLIQNAQLGLHSADKHNT